jgi:hypothetical protein
LLWSEKLSDACAPIQIEETLHMPGGRIHTTKRADEVPPSQSELRANLQGLGRRDNRLLASRREVLLGASGLVLLAICPPPVGLDPSGQEPWGDGTLWSDGLGWIA